MDMGKRVCKAETIYEYLLLCQKVREAKRFIKTNYQFVETLSIIRLAKLIENVKIKKDYVHFAKALITKKYPNTMDKYVEEVENEVFKGD